MFHITVFIICQMPYSPPPPIFSPPSIAPIVQKQWWELLLDPPVLIPVILGAIILVFLFIFIFRFCNKERSDGVVNVIDSVGNTASKLNISDSSPRKNETTIYVGKTVKKKEPPKIQLK
jgi:hypothetical protein